MKKFSTRYRKMVDGVEKHFSDHIYAESWVEAQDTADMLGCGIVDGVISQEILASSDRPFEDGPPDPGDGILEYDDPSAEDVPPIWNEIPVVAGIDREKISKIKTCELIALDGMVRAEISKREWASGRNRPS